MSNPVTPGNVRMMKDAVTRRGNQQAVAKELQHLLADIGRCRLAHVKPSSRLREDLGIDSFTGMEILVAIEQRYSLQIPEAEVSRTVTVKDLVKLITRKSARRK